MSDADPIDATLLRAPVIPVYTPSTPAAAIEVTRALARGGLPVIEVTLRNDGALAALAAIAREVPDALVGAGTVLTPDQGQAAIDAGARFLVSPGSTPALLAAARTWSVPLLPGIASASELMLGLEAGLRRFKFFPAAAAGGVPLLRALSGPFPQVRFCPTGGISLDSAGEYLSLSNVLCIGGSWLTPDDAIAAGDWARIERLARTAAALPRANAP